MNEHLDNLRASYAHFLETVKKQADEKNVERIELSIDQMVSDVKQIINKFDSE